MKKINLTTSLTGCKLSSTEMRNVVGGNCTVYYPFGPKGNCTEAEAKASGYNYSCQSSNEQPK